MLDDDIELDDAEESIEALVHDKMLAPVFCSDQEKRRQDFAFFMHKMLGGL